MAQVVMALFAVAMLLAACAPAAPAPTAPGQAPPGPQAPPQAPAASAPTASTQTAGASPYGNAAEWERTQEAGKREGRVVVAGPGFPGLRNALIEGFQRAHGITLEYLSLSGAEVVSRVDREARTGGPTLDVYMGGFTGCWTMAERDQVEDIRAYLLDPVALAPAGWTGGQLKFLEASPDMLPDSKCGLLNTQWVMTDLFVNRDLVPPASIRSWRDLLKPEYKGKIASFDPRRPGAAQTTVPYLSRLFGIDYLRDLYVGQEVALTAEARQLAEWVARGAYPIGIALVQPAVEPLRAEGLPLERVFPADGPGVLTPGSGSILRIKNGPNPNAAAVFINWMASKEAQEIWEREMLETSLRTDVSHQVPDYVIPKPGIQYPVDAADPEQYFKYGADARAALQQLLGR
ncbi:MAG TPA: extracellular solute-binding protein [Chloroflexota bacterium]|jgi:ABC-type Fe3+ transport system substrate-binding protein